MPTVTATSCLATPLTGLADLIAAQTSWQQWCEVSTEADARARVHIGSVRDPLNVVRPFAVVDWEEQTFRQSGYTRGGLVLRFEASVPEPYREDNSDPLVDFYNHVGAVIDDVTNAGEDPTADRTFIDKLSGFVMKAPAQRSDLQEPDDYFQIEYRVNIGIGN